MPVYTEQTKKLKALQLIKTYQKNHFNQHKTAKALGTTQPSIADRLKKPWVQSLLRKSLEKINPEKVLVPDYVLRNFMEDRHLALTKDDITNAIRCDEFFAEYLKMVEHSPLLEIHLGQTERKILDNYIDINSLDE